MTKKTKSHAKSHEVGEVTNLRVKKIADAGSALLKEPSLVSRESMEAWAREELNNLIEQCNESGTVSVIGDVPDAEKHIDEDAAYSACENAVMDAIMDWIEARVGEIAELDRYLELTKDKDLYLRSTKVQHLRDLSSWLHSRADDLEASK